MDQKEVFYFNSCIAKYHCYTRKGWSNVLNFIVCAGCNLVTEEGVSGLYKLELGWDTCPTELSDTLK